MPSHRIWLALKAKPLRLRLCEAGEREVMRSLSRPTLALRSTLGRY